MVTSRSSATSRVSSCEREEGRVDTEDLGDAQQHGHRQRAHIVLDLVEVAGRDLQHLGQRRLTEAPLAAQLAHP